jgi:hypothetical protein
MCQYMGMLNNGRFERRPEYVIRCSPELIFTFVYAGSNIQNSSKQFVSCVHISFVNFPLTPTPTNKNITELGLEIQTALFR